MSNVLRRTITGVGIVTVVVCCLLLGAYSFFILCALIAFLGLREFYHLFSLTRSHLRSVAGYSLWFALFTALYLFRFHQVGWKGWLICVPAISLIFLTVLFKKSANPFQELALTFFGHLYVSIPFVVLYMSAFALNSEMFNKDVLLGYFFLLWANDTGAYAAGSLMGRHPLAPAISPKKTWEGSAGGVAVAVAVAFINGYLFQDLSLPFWFVTGAIVVIMGTLGDLVKSVMKRSLGVKDSGTILPGHGGILDRFDSLIGSVPVFFTYLTILGS